MSETRPVEDQVGNVIEVAVPKTFDRFWVQETAHTTGNNACQVRQDEDNMVFLSCQHCFETVQTSIPFDVFHKHFKAFVQAMKVEQKRLEEAKIRKPQ